ncbi:MAG: DUF2194 domain-containing protein [Lachnospiraceae bacterium]|nr:DUF2194 domain-containing protein [Lachnospiraceae bacterium]
MLTNRKLFSIIIMIAVLFLLFQGSQAVRESLNHYEVNNFREETGLSASDVPDPESFAAEHRVLFIGDDESNEGKTVQEWASDVRYSFASVSAVNEALSYYSESAPALICIEGRCLTEADIPSLQELVNSGARLFFTSLPDAAFIENNEDIMKLLGIREVRAEETEITGTRLYSGFLLGGERVYEAETPEEEKRQDMDLTVPWFITGAGTETYMNGLFSDEATKALDKEYGDELLPALIWRTSIGDARIFAVAGDYMEDRRIGIGLLSAALSKTSSYSIYPVINAQNVTLVTFPTAANENAAMMQEIYGQTMTQVENRLILPRLESLGLQEGYSFTGAYAPRLRYADGAPYEAGLMEGFLSNMNEMSCELGISLVEDDSRTAAEKAAETRGFLQGQGVTYKIGSVVVKASDLQGDAAFLDDPLLQDLQTVSVPYDDAYPIAGYYISNEKAKEKGLTLQQMTQDASDYTYTRDLELVGTETALAYTNWAMDITSSLLPDSEEDQWQKSSKTMFANLTGALSPFKDFSKTTLSEADAAVRRFAAIDYRDSREGDTVTLSVKGRQGKTFFLLRTNGEEVKEVTGGSFQKLEDGAYLIGAEEDTLSITLAGEDITSTKSN